MIRLVAFLLVILALAAGLHWLADRPGTIIVDWLGYVAETSMFRALIILALRASAGMLAWSLLRAALAQPRSGRPHLNRRRQKRGLDALTERHHRRRRRRPRAGRPLCRPGAQGAAASSRSRICCARRPPRSAATAPPRGASSRPCSPRRIPSSSACAACFSKPQREGEQEAARQFARAGAAAQPQARLAGRGAVRLAVPGRGLAGRAGHARHRAPPAPDRQGRRPLAGAPCCSRHRRRRPRTQPPTRRSSWRRRPTGWRPIWFRPLPSPAACSPRRAIRRGPRACCSRPGVSLHIPISPPPMPTPGPATARATGSTACAISPRLTPQRHRGADRGRHQRHRGARVGRGAQGAGAAARRSPDAARRAR